MCILIFLTVTVRTWMMRGGVRPGDRADDVEVLEKDHAPRGSEVRRRPGQPLHTCDGYSGLAGLQHHHHGIDVWDGDARILSETPAGKKIIYECTDPER